MNSKSNIEKFKELNVGEVIFVLFIIISIVGIIANELDKKSILNNNNSGKKTTYYIRLAILFISLLIYLYFLKATIKKGITTKSFLNNLNILATILFVIGGIIFLYTEYKGDEEFIIIE